MRIVSLDELPASLDVDRAMVQLGTFSRFLDRDTAAIYRRHRLLAEYVALFGVDRGEVAGMLLVLRLPFRSAEGLETVAGIASVTTRVDKRRHGVARALLHEAHRRERAAGVRFSLLWTSRAWFAHDLYESLGYRDVHTPPLAARAVRGGRKGAATAALRPAKRGDLRRLEDAYHALREDCYGFGPRPRGFLRVEQRTGALDLGGLEVFRRGGHLTGYAVVHRAPHQVFSDELVAPAAELPGLLRAVERLASTGVVVLSSTTVRAAEPFLRRRGYLVRREGGWRGLMACSLGPTMETRALRVALAVDRPSFSCMEFDHF